MTTLVQETDTSYLVEVMNAENKSLPSFSVTGKNSTRQHKYSLEFTKPQHRVRLQNGILIIYTAGQYQEVFSSTNFIFYQNLTTKNL